MLQASDSTVLLTLGKGEIVCYGFHLAHQLGQGCNQKDCAAKVHGASSSSSAGLVLFQKEVCLSTSLLRALSEQRLCSPPNRALICGPNEKFCSQW